MFNSIAKYVNFCHIIHRISMYNGGLKSSENYRNYEGTAALVQFRYQGLFIQVAKSINLCYVLHSRTMYDN